MGHIGFTPQFKKKFKIEGETKQKALELLKEAISIGKAGAFSIVLECLSPRASKLITKILKSLQLELAPLLIVMGRYLLQMICLN